jgi:hypothetical protein
MRRMLSRIFVVGVLSAAAFGQRGQLLGDDAPAAYETQEALLSASNGAANDEFGISVAVDRRTAVVGADQHNAFQGAAYVFVQNGDGTWGQKAELTASDGVIGDSFGFSVAVSGNTAVVGAFCHPSSGYTCSNPGPGAAYVFVRSDDGTWSEQAELTASDGVPGDAFGISVAIDGNTVAVGASQHGDHGAAYLFERDGDGRWIQQAELTAPNGGAFGFSVAVSGSKVVVGADIQMVGSNSAQGAAYVFAQNGSTWGQQAELIASDGAEYDYFGRSLAISGGTAVVGASQHTVGSNSRQGAAYVFVQNGTTWSQQAELTASDGAAGDAFGYSVGVKGATAVVGAYTKNNFRGAAYVFSQSDTAWSQEQELTASDPAGSSFGSSAAISARTIVVGAVDYQVGSNQDQGAAYVFLPTTVSTWRGTLTAPQ